MLQPGPRFPYLAARVVLGLAVAIVPVPATPSGGPTVAEVEQGLEVLQLFLLERSDSLDPELEPLRSPSVGPSSLEGAGLSSPDPSLTIANDLALGGAIFKGSSPILHTEGQQNTGVGYAALKSITTGSENVAVGEAALLLNDEGTYNTAVGQSTLLFNTAGFSNTAVGEDALYSNTEGDANTALGRLALSTNITGSHNAAIGANSLRNNIDGDRNVALGFSAGRDATGDHNIFISHDGLPTDNGVIRIGDDSNHSSTFIAGIFGSIVQAGSSVEISSTGKLGTTPSSRRFKEEIHDMDETSSSVLDLRPVTFRYTEEARGDGPRPIEFGLIAEEVAQIYPDLVVYDEEDEPYSVRYQVLAPMLLNELQRQEREIQALVARLRHLESGLP